MKWDFFCNTDITYNSCMVIIKVLLLGMKKYYIYAFGFRFPIWEGGNSVNIYGDICWIFNDITEYYTYYKNEKVTLKYNK